MSAKSIQIPCVGDLPHTLHTTCSSAMYTTTVCSCPWMQSKLLHFPSAPTSITRVRSCATLTFAYSLLLTLPHPKKSRPQIDGHC
ncbi:hypothetical protein BDW02DRAFT_424762 [Decorospora gaudefroyi]|uniref:Uncharacterized protein n=1 Tax=Decorospora gaudefroyi TaxID=184978 RepID=A0A6A5K8A5_9PLEO|nr:hypothetical protein BDW02DRAFT_41732 [Decorospora gaudefroyi]KAF1832520.1 hypothetical protein BDW02DRAFT_424762 [Decorospora gaudefroyi]